jgi:hypothetical protein
VLGTDPGANAAPGEVAIEYHCAGGSRLAADSHLPTFHKVLALARTPELQNLALSKCSRLVANNLQFTNNASSASLIKALLRDVVEMESLGSFGEAKASGPSFILAVHLTAQRAQLWQDNCSKILGGNGEVFTIQKFGGRRWNVGRSNSLWMVPAHDWLLVGCGNDFSPLLDEYLMQIKSLGRPVPALQHTWLEADLSSARLGGWFHSLKPSRLRMTVAPNEDDLQISVRMFSEEVMPWKSNSWQIPKDLIRGQIISFTAGQNVAAFLNLDPAFSHLFGYPLTNQFYSWALDQMPFLNYAAWPVANANKELERLSSEAPSVLNSELNQFNGTELVWNAKDRKLAWLNMGMFVPMFEAVKNNDGQFLFFYGFPQSPNNKPAPDALLARIEGRTNLVYYDWELTGRRLSQWQILKGMVANRARGTNEDALSDMEMEIQWKNGVAGLLGSTATEITSVASNELSLERKSTLGFTAVELTLLADWICDADSGPIHSPAKAGNRASRPFQP